MFGLPLRFFLLGFCAGLLLAPRPGRETREQLRQTVASVLEPLAGPRQDEQRLRLVEEQISALE